MASSSYVVVGPRGLNMPRGAYFAVGERLGLDPDLPAHKQIIEAGWVRPVVEAPPVNTMVASAPVKKKRVASPETRRRISEAIKRKHQERRARTAAGGNTA